MTVAPKTGVIFSQPHSNDRAVSHQSLYQSQMTLLGGGQSRLGRLVGRSYAVAPFGLITRLPSLLTELVLNGARKILFRVMCP